MLASYLVWHLREALAPLTFTDDAPPGRANPVAPAVRSAGARAKAAAKVNGEGEEVRGFRELLEHLGTLTRNTMRTTTRPRAPLNFSPRLLQSSAEHSNCSAPRCPSN